MATLLTVRGNLGQTISCKTIQNTSSDESSVVLSFSIASTEFKKTIVDGVETLTAGHTEWFECEYWNRQAEHISSILLKGMPVTVEGKEIISFYEKDGNQIKTRKIRVKNLYLNLDSNRVENIVLKPAQSASTNNTETTA